MYIKKAGKKNTTYIVHLKYMFSQTHPFSSKYECVILTINVYGTMSNFYVVTGTEVCVRERHCSEDIYTEVFTGKGAWYLQVTLK